MTKDVVPTVPMILRALKVAFVRPGLAKKVVVRTKVATVENAATPPRFRVWPALPIPTATPVRSVETTVARHAPLTASARKALFVSKEYARKATVVTVKVAKTAKSA